VAGTSQVGFDLTPGPNFVATLAKF